MSDPKIKINFAWESLTPDRRQWKPGMPVLKPMDCVVVVEVPLKGEYIDNAVNIIQAQLGNNSALELPLLTPKGMRYCINQLENVMTDEPVVKKQEDDNENWDEVSTEIEDWNTNKEE